MAGILDEFLLIFRPTVQGNGLSRLNQGLRETHNNLFSLKNLFGAFIGYDIYSGIKEFAGSMVNASRELGAMTSRFYAITKSEELANDELQWTFKLAERTAMGLKSTADAYSIFYAATQKGLGTSGARQVFQDWTEVSRVLHLSEYQFERVTYALREMSSKGAIYSQDLRMQIGTHVPNAMGLAEKAVNELGVTGDNWFEDFRKKAKGNQKLINQFIMLFSKYAKEMYASPEALEKALQQPDAQITRLKNQWDKLRYAMADAGFSEDLSKNLMRLNDLLDKMVTHADKLYSVLKGIGGLLVTIFAFGIFTKFSKFLMSFSKMGKTGIFAGIFSFFTRLGRYWKLTIGNLKIVKLLFSRFGFLAIRSILPFLGKGLLNFIPIIGNIIFAIWTIIDVVKLLWRILKFFFPDVIRAIELRWCTMINTIVTGVKTAIEWLKKLKFWENWGKDKDTNAFPGVQPQQGTWDYEKSQYGLTPLANYAYGNRLSSAKTTPTTPNQNITVSPKITNTTTINADGLTQEQLAQAMQNANDKNNQQLMAMLTGGVAGSLYKNY